MGTFGLLNLVHSVLKMLLPFGSQTLACCGLLKHTMLEQKAPFLPYVIFCSGCHHYM